MAKVQKTKSVYSTSIQKLITTCYRKRMTSLQAATRINESATAKKLGVSYNANQMRTIFGNITRQNCGWFEHK